MILYNLLGLKIDFVITTLWSDISIEASSYINDFNFISDFTRDTYLNSFNLSKQFISEYQRNNDQNHVVTTHHAPSFKSLSPKFCGNVANSAFISNCENLINKDTLLWVHGNTHQNFDYIINDAYIVCRPFGYNNENSDFNIKRVVIK